MGLLAPSPFLLGGATTAIDEMDAAELLLLFVAPAVDPLTLSLLLVLEPLLLTELVSELKDSRCLSRS